jgi:hypothetical protein
MSGFVVQGPKSDYRDSSGLKNRLFPFTNVLLMLLLKAMAASFHGTSTQKAKKLFCDGSKPFSTYLLGHCAHDNHHEFVLLVGKLVWNE